MREILPGKYIHYKGGLYQVFGEGRNTETPERFAVYKPLYFMEDEEVYQLRPKEMFLEEVETRDGEKRLRFKKEEDQEFLGRLEKLTETLRPVMREGKVSREQYYVFCLMFSQDFDFEKALKRVGLENESEDFYKDLALRLGL